MLAERAETVKAQTELLAVTVVDKNDLDRSEIVEGKRKRKTVKRYCDGYYNKKSGALKKRKGDADEDFDEIIPKKISKESVGLLAENGLISLP
jgi:hypothetical protein